MTSFFAILLHGRAASQRVTSRPAGRDGYELLAVVIDPADLEEEATDSGVVLGQVRVLAGPRSAAHSGAPAEESSLTVLLYGNNYPQLQWSLNSLTKIDGVSVLVHVATAVCRPREVYELLLIARSVTCDVGSTLEAIRVSLAKVKARHVAVCLGGHALKKGHLSALLASVTGRARDSRGLRPPLCVSPLLVDASGGIVDAGVVFLDTATLVVRRRGGIVPMRRHWISP